MKVVNKNKVLLGGIIGLIILNTSALLYYKFSSKEAIIPQVKEQENKNNTFAIMLEQSDGTYEKTTSTSFNQSGYLYNSAKSGCIDVTGQKLDNALNYDGITKQIIVRTNSTAFCYIYFDIKAKDVEIELKTDGESGKLPTTGGYKNTLVCSEGIGTFNNKYQRLEITDVKAKCTLNYEKDTSTHTSLINIVQSASGIVNEEDAGSRYEGPNPDNYIWFNNEMWRIIGSIPTKVDSSGTTTNLVKIIRKDSFGGIAYDLKSSGSTGEWGNNTLYTLLNEYYYGKKDGTNTDYCRYVKCDYRVNGISSASTDYYGKMVKNVYWNTGRSSDSATASEVYANEKSKQTVQGRIGLMSESDYKYAASSSDLKSNWLFSAQEWTSTQSSSNAGTALCVGGGYTGAIGNLSIRPVVYLNENVYVLSGSGTEVNPYIIGI